MMRRSQLYIFAILVFTMFALTVQSQTILRDTIQYEIVDSINPSNDSLVNNLEYPDWFNNANQLVEIVALRLDTSWWTSEIDDVVIQWKKENDVKDDGDSNYYYGLIKDNDDNYCVKKLLGTVNYLFSEIGGGYTIERVINVDEENISEIICLFEKEIKLEERAVHLQFIESSVSMRSPIENVNKEEILERNIKFSFEFNEMNYSLFYSADFSRNGFSFDGLGTVYPTYYNIELKLVNNSGIEQTLYQYPNGVDYNISEIISGDIDNDSQLDIIYKICDEICIRRVIFLSSRKGANQLMEYIGQTEIECIDP